MSQPNFDKMIQTELDVIADRKGPVKRVRRALRIIAVTAYNFGLSDGKNTGLERGAEIAERIKFSGWSDLGDPSEETYWNGKKIASAIRKEKEGEK